jgi:hypothetical protein
MEGMEGHKIKSRIFLLKKLSKVVVGAGKNRLRSSPSRGRVAKPHASLQPLLDQQNRSEGQNAH